MTEETAFQNDQQEVRQATRSFWKKMLVGIGLCLVMLAFMAWVCLFHEVPLEISKETTYITEPLTADGKQVDYFRALELEFESPDMATDKNGYRMIIQSMGVDPDCAYTPEIITEVYRKLDLTAASVKPTMSLQEPERYLFDYFEKFPKVEEQILRNQKGYDKLGCYDGREAIDPIYRPWNLEQMPMMADWLKANEPTLDMLAKAVRQPTFIIPLVRANKDTMLDENPLLDHCRSFTFYEALQARSNYRIAKGDIDGAIDDIITFKTLCRHFRQNGRRSGCYSIRKAYEIGIAGSLKHVPTKSQLERLLGTLGNTTEQKNTALVQSEKIGRFDRYRCLDAIQKLAHADSSSKRLELLKEIYGGEGYYPKGIYFIPYFKYNWNYVMQRVNEADHDPASLSHQEPYLFLELPFPSPRSELLADLICCVILSVDSSWPPPKDMFHSYFPGVNKFDQIQAITLAMLIYEKEHGHLPPAWTVDKQGKPLHSWRVLLLPYLGDDAKELYEKIRLEEPWDSEHNRQFHNVASTLYQSPSDEAKPGETHYTVVVGPKTAFRNETGVKLDELGPNLANLALVFECEKMVNWMDPKSDPTVVTTNRETLKWNHGCHLIGFRDGSARQISDLNYSDPPDKSDITIQKLSEGTVETMLN